MNTHWPSSPSRDSARLTLRVPDMPGKSDHVGEHLSRNSRGQARYGRQLNDLLMTTLQTAVALVH